MSLIKRIIFYLIYTLISLSFILFTLEFGSRLIMPISPGIKLVDKNEDVVNYGFNDPETKYWQKSSEFLVETNITKIGYRFTENSENKSVSALVFLGDSFTFGIGVSDKKTISSLVCKNFNAKCFNLGVPGTGGIAQYDSLKSFFEIEEIPTKGIIVHLILASTSDAHAGNDIVDTISEISSRDSLDNIKIIPFSPTRYNLTSIFRSLSKRSNFIRVVRIYAGNYIKGIAFSRGPSTIADKDIDVFGNQINKTGRLVIEKGYRYLPILLSTYGEIKNNKHKRTFRQLSERTEFTLHSPDYEETDASTFFYPLDGHFNQQGTAAISSSISKILANDGK